MFDYENRKVDLYQSEELYISTAYVQGLSPVFGGFKPYETAVEHPKYKNGDLIVVEAYNTKEDAKKGHEKWIKIMTSNPLPKKLTDCANNFLAQMAIELGAALIYEKEK